MNLFRFCSDSFAWACYMANGSAKNRQHKNYARYAAHCLSMVTAASTKKSRSIQRAMAAEWLRLADLALENEGRRPKRWAVLAVSRIGRKRRQAT
jgi:hypothetical protein